MGKIMSKINEQMEADSVAYNAPLEHDYVAAHEYLTNPENKVNKIIKPVGSAADWVFRHTPTQYAQDQVIRLVRNTASGHDDAWWERKCAGLEGRLNLLQQGICAEKNFTKISNMEDLLVLAAPEAPGLVGMKAAKAAQVRIQVERAMENASGKYEQAYAKLLDEVDAAVAKTNEVELRAAAAQDARATERATAQRAAQEAAATERAAREAAAGRVAKHEAERATKRAMRARRKTWRRVRAEHEAEMRALERAAQDAAATERAAKAVQPIAHVAVAATLPLAAAPFMEDPAPPLMEDPAPPLMEDPVPRVPSEQIHVPPPDDTPFHPDLNFKGATEGGEGGAGGAILLVLGGVVAAYVIYRIIK